MLDLSYTVASCNPRLGMFSIYRSILPMTNCFPSLDEPSLASKSFVRHCIDGYFANADSSDCVFLHKASILSSWHQDNLDPVLLKILCASALRLMAKGQEPESAAFTWAREVQDSLSSLNALDGRSVTALQSLVMVIRFHFASQFANDAWVLLAVAARVGFTMRLNYEQPSSSTSQSVVKTVRRECMRRLMWAIFTVDKLFSGGIEDLTVCPSRRMHIRLPCNHDAFQQGRVPKSPFLHEHLQENTPDSDISPMDAGGYRIRLLDIRDRIFR